MPRYTQLCMCTSKHYFLTDLVHGGVALSSGSFQAFVCTLSGFHTEGVGGAASVKREAHEAQILTCSRPDSQTLT